MVAVVAAAVALVACGGSDAEPATTTAPAMPPASSPDLASTTVVPDTTGDTGDTGGGPAPGGFATTFDPDVAPGASALMAGYGVVLAVLAASTWWLGRTYGWRPSAPAVAGCLLAVVADWLIATFWIFGDGYPTIEHVNWIIYYASLALIGRLPFVVADGVEG